MNHSLSRELVGFLVSAVLSTVNIWVEVKGIVPIIIISRKRIAWNETAGKELRATVTLSHSGGKPFRILSAESTSPYIKADGYSSNTSTEHKLDVIMTKDAKAGIYHELLTVKLDDPEQSELEIGVVAALR